MQRYNRPHVSGEFGLRIRNFLNPLSRVEIFEYATSTASCGRSNPEIFVSADVTVSEPVFNRANIQQQQQFIYFGIPI